MKGFLLLLVATTLLAQGRDDTTPKSIQGAVTDTTDKTVDGAVVQLKDTKTLQIRSFITKADGARSMWKHCKYPFYRNFRPASERFRGLHCC